MRAVWKYKLRLAVHQVLTMPEDARELCVANRQGQIFLWAEVTPNAPPEEREVFAIVTGGEVPPGHAYVGTVLNGEVILHYYVGPSPKRHASAMASSERAFGQGARELAGVN